MALPVAKGLQRKGCEDPSATDPLTIRPKQVFEVARWEFRCAFSRPQVLRYVHRRACC